jgi:DNA-binding CsgD family transcriptional regulator
MRHAPPVLRALFGRVLPPSADHGAGDAPWWPRFREAAEALPHAAEDLVAIAREAVTRAEEGGERRLFVSVRASFAHALEEPAAPAALALRVAAQAAGGSAIAVTLHDGAHPSAAGMALVQGALLGFGEQVAQRAVAGDRDARSCALEVGMPRESFVERLLARGLDDDAAVLGLDAEKLGRLVDGALVPDAPARSNARPTASLAMRALETDFKLTPTQARLALRLAEGASLREAAERLEMSYATARVHLKAIFAKLEVRTQGALVAKVLGVRA